jgi:hypothetical protein
MPYSTLQKTLKQGLVSAPKIGRKPVFSEGKEQALTDNLVRRFMFYGVTSIQMRRTVECCGITRNFDRNKQAAGPDWFQAFVKRSSGLSVRKPEAISINRIQDFNKEEVTRFFENLEQLMTKYSFPAKSINNMHESGFSTVQVPSLILAPKGLKRVGAVISWEKSRNITVICAMSVW